MLDCATTFVVICWLGGDFRVTNDTALNIKIPDKLYYSLKKAAEQKSLSLAALVRMVCSDWVMEQPKDIKGVFTYPEHLLEGLSQESRTQCLQTVVSGGYVYNDHGEACYDHADDGLDDDAYEQLCSTDEVTASLLRVNEHRASYGQNFGSVSIGNVILANFPFEDDRNRFKQRPAVVMRVAENMLSVMALKITTTPPREKLDYELMNWALAGLNRASTVRTSKRAEISVSAIVKVLGTLSASDFDEVWKLYDSLRDD